MIQKRFLVKIALLTVVCLVIVMVAGTTMRTRQITNSANAQTNTVFSQFVLAGGPIVWFILLPMSLLMVSLAVEHCLTIRRKKLVPPGIARDIVTVFKRSGATQLIMHLVGRNDFVSVAVARLVAQGATNTRQMQTDSLLAGSLQEQALRCLRRLEWVNIIGNIAPMVGLFGTILGMIKTFNSIVAAGGQPQPGHLAAGISVALVTTLWGLLVAIPALVVHAIFRNRIETLVAEAAQQAETVLLEINDNSKTHQLERENAAQQKLESRIKQIKQISSGYTKVSDKEKGRQQRIIAAD